jgi:hypothetical protein
VANDKLGATGGFPDGKLNGADEGGLRFAIGEEGGNVVINFGKPVAWLGMPPEQAVAMAELLIRKARIVARRTGKVLTVSM